MKVEHDQKSGAMVITLKLDTQPKESKSGKTLIVASTRGTVMTPCEVDGHSVSLSLNAYIPNDKYEK